jgi:hypothetical protein
MKELIKEAKRLQELANIPSDVSLLNKATNTSTTLQSKAKNINSANEFPGAFEVWFKTLGFKPGKISKSYIRSSIEKILTDLGYK